MTKKTSPTTISKFLNCPFAYKLKKIDQVAVIEVFEPRRNIGINMHAIIKGYYTHMTSKPTPKQVEVTATNCFKNLFDESLNEYKREMQVMLNNFIAFEVSRIPNYRVAEIVEGWVEDDIYGGYVDMFDGINGYDWKGKSLLKLYDDNLIQGKTYERIMKNKGYSQACWNFVGLENGKVLTMPSLADSWLDGKKAIMDNCIVTGDFPIKKGPLCAWCDVALACQYKFKNLWDDILECLTI